MPLKPAKSRRFGCMTLTLQMTLFCWLLQLMRQKCCFKAWKMFPTTPSQCQQNKNSTDEHNCDNRYNDNPKSMKDFKPMKAQAWTACNRLEEGCISVHGHDTKLAYFKAYVERILLYGSVTRNFEDWINGCYTQLPQCVKIDVRWQDQCPVTW